MPAPPPRPSTSSDPHGSGASSSSSAGSAPPASTPSPTTGPRRAATYSIYAKLRDYNGTTDLEELGGIDFWIDSVAVDGSLNRALLTHGVPVTITVPDEHRLPEAVITAIGIQPSKPTLYAGTTLQRVQFGRGVIATDGVGAGSTTVTFPVAFSATPTALAATADDGTTLTLSSITSVHFTATAAGGPLNSYAAFSWHASGNH